MTIGASIFCLVAGAILTFAVETDSTEGININNVGIILMLAGVIGLVVYYAVWAPRTRRVDRTVVVADPVVQQPVVQQRVVAAPASPVVEERRVYPG